MQLRKLIVGGLLLSLPLFPSNLKGAEEREYRGLTASEWATFFSPRIYTQAFPLRDGMGLEMTMNRRFWAQRAFRIMGPNAAKSLGKSLRWRDTPETLALRNSGIPLRQLRLSGALPAASHAQLLMAISALGQRAKDLIPDIAACFDLNVPKKLVASTLAWVGPDSVPFLNHGLSHEDSEVRKACATALAVFGPDSIPQLRKGLSDRDPTVREACIRALGRLGPASAAAIPEIGTLLRRGEAVIPGLQAFRQIGAPASVVLSVCRPLLKDNDSSTTAFALKTIASLGVEAAESLPDVLALIDHDDVSVRVSAARTARQIGGPDVEGQTLPVLIKSLSEIEASYSVLPTAIPALGEIGPTAEAAFPQLAQLLYHDHFNSKAAQALFKIAPERVRKEVIPSVLSDLKSNDEIKQYLALNRACALASSFDSMTDEVERMLKDPSQDILSSIEPSGPPPERFIPLLIAQLKTADRIHAASLAAKLQDYEQSAKPAIPELFALLERFPKDLPVWRSVIRSFRAIDPDLLERFDDEALFERVYPDQLLNAMNGTIKMTRSQRARVDFTPTEVH